MAKDPAFLFYSSDFLTGTMFFSYEQLGIYIRLLCSQHQHGGLIDKISFNAMVGDHLILRSKFIETENGFYNERLTEEMEKRSKKSSNLSKAAKEIWEKRKIDKNTIVQKIDTIVLQKHNNSNTKVNKIDTIAIQPENENENENEIKIKRIRNSEIWLNEVSKMLKISFEDIKQKIEEFLQELKLKEDLRKDDKEIKSHFINWLKVNIEKEKKSSKKEKGDFINPKPTYKKTDLINR